MLLSKEKTADVVVLQRRKNNRKTTTFDVTIPGRVRTEIPRARMGRLRSPANIAGKQATDMTVMLF
ncbi:hypothetical protein BC829DRAFT_401048 [Chytridium lagenaria]|nr:hypothetical protein BC829DRAFT_401048 [Chytridium lagenaria]